jgi:hypothetical protein
MPTTPPASDQQQPAASVQINESLILASVANGAYKYSPQFTPVNVAPYASSIAAKPTINVWVTSSDFTAYTKIDPDKSGSGVTLPPGATIVREVLGADGNVAKLTLMTKGPAGYNPELGDFWFAVAKPDGTVLEDGGARQAGKLTQCFGCHTPRAHDGYLFGVPAAARMRDPGMPPPMMEPPVTLPPPPPPAPVCGDFWCDVYYGESCLNCPSDCGICGGGGDDHGGGGGGGGGGDDSGGGKGKG